MQSVFWFIMEILKFILTFLLIFSLNSCKSFRKKDIDYFKLDFEHSRRIPYNKLSIELFKKSNEATIKIHSRPLLGERAWDYSVIDTTFKLSLNEFLNIAKNVEKLKSCENESPSNIGKDGSYCPIQFGSKGKYKTCTMWSPDYETEKRGLDKFLKLSESIIILGQLNPKDIL